MITVWRIVKKKYEASAFDGEGARRYGGRWNSDGRPMIYASESQSLAVLEMLVHLDSSLLTHYVLIPAIIDRSLIADLDRRLLPDDWRAYPSPQKLRLLGDRWLSDLKTPVLKVPSCILPLEANYLINPQHPDFTNIRIGTSMSFEPDSRLPAYPLPTE